MTRVINGTLVGEVERRLKENGLTYQAHTSEHHKNRQGQLDVVPYLMDESTFKLFARACLSVCDS